MRMLSVHSVNKTLADYYRLPFGQWPDRASEVAPSTGEPGFFRLNSGTLCYGRCGTSITATPGTAPRLPWFSGKPGQRKALPFSFPEVINNLRMERYLGGDTYGAGPFAGSGLIRNLYYLIRENIPDGIRHQLQKIYFRGWKHIPFPSWPVDTTVESLHKEFLRDQMEQLGMSRIPFVWFWPNGARNVLMVTHDVETAAGRDFTIPLIELDATFGFRSSFQVIPEKRYEVADTFIADIRRHGCEVNVHDLNHDGRLYRERNEFLRRAAKINTYVQRFGAGGFRSGAMYRNQDWLEAFEFSYDMSVPNVAHLEPMRGGCCTVMPYFVGRILELPLTTVQDYSLFHILNQYSLDLWKQQIEILRKEHGLISVVTHPDYLIEPRARAVYTGFLEYLQGLTLHGGVLALLPGEVDRWWRQRSEMELVPQGDGWRITGDGHERARIAYAVREGGQITYELP